MQLRACAYDKILLFKAEFVFSVSHLFVLFEMVSYHK